MLRRNDFALALVVFAVSVFVLGWFAGSATAAAPCNRIYKAPDTFVANHGIRVNATPAGIGFARCLRATGQR